MASPIRSTLSGVPAVSGCTCGLPSTPILLDAILTPTTADYWRLAASRLRHCLQKPRCVAARGSVLKNKSTVAMRWCNDQPKLQTFTVVYMMAVSREAP
jgi:hypothetical protein